MKSGHKVFFACAALIVLLEAVVFFLFLGDRKSIFSLNSESAPEPPPAWTEVEIGNYEVRSSAFGDVDVQVKMSVYAMIESEKSGDFRQELEKKRRRVDEAVSTVVRNADYIELQEPTLHSLRRRVTYAVKKVLGDHMQHVDEIILPDFRADPL